MPSIRAFILGSRRSGSNLLRIMLNSSPHLAAPHPPHILHAFAPLLCRYGDLARDDAWSRLVADVVEYANLNPVALLEGGARLEPDAVAARCAGRGLVWLHDAVYAEIMARNGKQAWVCKSNDNIHYLEAIEACFADSARYIYLYRDGRDVSLSFRQAPIGPKHPYVCAVEWAREQRCMLDWEQRVGGRLRRMRYEDLIAHPEAACRELCDFLGVAFHPAMLEAHASGEAARTAEKSVLWANLTQPVRADNREKWRRDAPHNVRQFERAAADALQALGYPVSGPVLAAPDAEEAARILAEDHLLREAMLARLETDAGTRGDQAAFLARRREEQAPA
ncbi:MAG TPA: sulfotransferase [Thiobacillaceae bacterium]|nr:sulfotransferase [Thiobacillaceae bacterium]HNH90380.1 sulfotransferase [Thiobacillaceae bacterium]HNI06971.1 sulfotransferase [Thiobacillaceae bacterium]